MQRMTTKAEKVENASEPGVRFEDLPEDIRLRVIEYLPYCDRVRFERINQTFKRCVQRSFAAQKVFATSFINLCIDIRCTCDEHQFRRCDYYQDSGTDYFYLNRPSWHVLRRCSNLQALYWNGHPLATNWGEKLARKCPSLEHVYFRDLMTFSGFTSYPRELRNLGKECRLKCVLIGEDDEEMADTYDDEMVHFFKLCSRLETYVNYSCFNTYRVVELIVDKIAMFYVTQFDNLDKCVDLIAESGKNIAKLEIKDSLELRHLEKLVHLPNLVDVRIVSEACNIAALLLPESKKWKSIMWMPHLGTKYDEMQLNTVLCRIHSLRSLDLCEYNLKSKSLKDLHLYCPLLTHLGIYSSDKPVITDIVAKHIGKLKNLQSLTLRDLKITNAGLEHILNHCPALRRISLIVFRVTDKTVKLVTDYGREHPHRRICCYFDYAAVDKNRPPTCFKKDSLKPYVSCHNNVVITYCH